jgi:hypothetical protein
MNEPPLACGAGQRLNQKAATAASNRNVKDVGSREARRVGRRISVFDPKNIRSRFAQFDPAKAGSADILAGLGVVGAGAALSQQDGFDYGALGSVVEGSNGQRSN